jgi:deoxyribose-phosphate aldolase
MSDLSMHLDFANHHANATPKDIEKLCKEVIAHEFHAAFVNATYIIVAKKALAGKAMVGTVVSFPLGQDTTTAKVAAANNAASLGADELDVVPNLGLFMAGNEDGFLHDMSAVVEAAHMLGKPIIVKFILEPGYFDELPDKKEKMQRAAELIKLSGADYVKIGSGMGPRNPTLEDFQIVKEIVGDTMKIKVAGGITSREVAEQFIAAGVTRMGTSHAIEIVEGKSSSPNNQKSSE